MRKGRKTSNNSLERIIFFCHCQKMDRWKGIWGIAVTILVGWDISAKGHSIWQPDTNVLPKQPFLTSLRHPIFQWREFRRGCQALGKFMRKRLNPKDIRRPSIAKCPLRTKTISEGKCPRSHCQNIDVEEIWYSLKRSIRTKCSKSYGSRHCKPPWTLNPRSQAVTTFHAASGNLLYKFRHSIAHLVIHRDLDL
jgi:hypothetical protein